MKIVLKLIKSGQGLTKNDALCILWLSNLKLVGGI